MKGRWFWGGMAATAGYLSYVAWWFAQQDDRWLDLSPGDFGDFMGGVFGPVAFLWLVLGVQASREQLAHQLAAVEEEQARRAQLAKPKFRFEPRGYSSTGAGHAIRFAAKNVGAGAIDVQLTLSPAGNSLSPSNVMDWPRGAEKELVWIAITGSTPNEMELAISYVDAEGAHGAQEFKLSSEDPGGLNWSFRPK